MSELKKKHMTELRRALRAHALAVGDARVAYRRSEDTARRLSIALRACRDATEGSSFAASFGESESAIMRADLHGFECWTEARNEMQRLAAVVGASMPKWMTR